VASHRTDLRCGTKSRDRFHAIPGSVEHEPAVAMWDQIARSLPRHSRQRRARARGCDVELNRAIASTVGGVPRREPASLHCRFRLPQLPYSEGISPQTLGGPGIPLVRQHLFPARRTLPSLTTTYGGLLRRPDSASSVPIRSRPIRESAPFFLSSCAGKPRAFPLRPPDRAPAR
jgi:hypothetical protein